MGSLKLQSFEDFANASEIEHTAKLEEEQRAARDTAAESFKNLLAEFGVTSIKELNEEDRTKFFSKLGTSLPIIRFRLSIQVFGGTFTVNILTSSASRFFS